MIALNQSTRRQTDARIRTTCASASSDGCVKQLQITHVDVGAGPASRRAVWWAETACTRIPCGPDHGPRPDPAAFKMTSRPTMRRQCQSAAATAWYLCIFGQRGAAVGSMFNYSRSQLERHRCDNNEVLLSVRQVQQPTAGFNWYILDSQKSRACELHCFMRPLQMGERRNLSSAIWRGSHAKCRAIESLGSPRCSSMKHESLNVYRPRASHSHKTVGRVRWIFLHSNVLTSRFRSNPANAFLSSNLLVAHQTVQNSGRLRIFNL